MNKSSALEMDNQKQHFLWRIYHVVILCLLVTAIGFFILAHLNPGRLNLFTNFISQYAVSAPWGWMIGYCMRIFGVVYLLLAFGLLMRSERTPLLTVGAMLLCIAGALMFFVAIYTAVPVPEPHYNPTWMEKLKNWLPHPPPDTGPDRIAGVHNTMISLSNASLLSGVIFIGIEAVRKHQTRRFGIYCLGTPIVAWTMFSMIGSNLGMPGLFQRLGFIVVIVWLFIAAFHVRNFAPK